MDGKEFDFCGINIIFIALKEQIMKILSIKRLKETPGHHLTAIRFKTRWGKEIDATCITRKGSYFTCFFDSGEDIPYKLSNSVRVFLESDLQFFTP